MSGDDGLRLERLQMQLAALERSWQAAEPVEDGPAFDIWQAIGTVLSSTVAAATAGVESDGLVREIHFRDGTMRRALERHVREQADRHEGKLRDVYSWAKMAMKIVTETLDGTCNPSSSPKWDPKWDDVAFVVGQWSLILVEESPAFPKDATRARIEAAVRARQASWDKKARAWTNEEKAKSLVRAGLVALGWTGDPFAAEKMKRSRERNKKKAARTTRRAK